MRTAYTTSVVQVARLSLVRQGYDWSAPGRPEPLRGGGTNFERSPDRWFRLGKIYGSSQFRPTALARACSIRTYKGSSFEGTCLRNSLSALTVANAWISGPF